MQAIVYRQYGSPANLKLEEVETPTPKDDEILIKIHTTSVNRSDWEALTGEPLYARFGGLLKPGRPILGSDIAGRVVAMGKDHTHFKVGDEVFGETADYAGGFAEYVCARGKILALKPPRMTFEDAAAIPQSGVIALQGLRTQGEIQRGQKVLINGAGGGGGMFAIQLAKLSGAEVTGVDNTYKLDAMRGLGADHVIDYTREDFTRSGQQYDFILDLLAYRSVFDYQRALKPTGRYFMVGGSVFSMLQTLLLGPWIKRVTGKHLRLLMVQRSREALLAITELCMAGKIIPLIHRRFPLSQVPEALQFLGENRAKGKIVITINQESAA